MSAALSEVLLEDPPANQSYQRYPELTPYADLPLLTRLILGADGSTTLLLQTLVASKLSAESVPEDAASTQSEGCAERSEVFDHQENLAVRRSRLRDREGMIVSENLITYRSADSDVLIPRDATPFGVHTRRLGLFERRRIFQSGVTKSAFGAMPAGSAGRAYEILFSAGLRVLVHEIFNPSVLPTFLLPTLFDSRSDHVIHLAPSESRSYDAAV